MRSAIITTTNSTVQPVLPITVPTPPAGLSAAEQKVWCAAYLAGAEDALKYPGGGYQSGYAAGRASRESNRA